MTWWLWAKLAMIAFFAANALLMISLIGRERRPVTPQDAIAVVVGNSILIVALVAAP